MKSSGRRKRKALEISEKNHQQTVSEEKESAKGNCRGSRKPPGKGQCFLLEKEQNINLSGTGKSSSLCNIPPEMARVTEINVQTGEILPSAKMKLQFFPVTETTCLRLEKDGHNPFLELTLSARKKIQSIIKHLNNKWGSSGAAIGELMLFPYDMKSENFSTSRRWTADNGGITAGELYAILESPSVFRLRYDWFSNLHSESSEIFCASYGAASETNNLRKICNSFSSISCLPQWLKADNQDIRNSFDVHNVADVALTGQESVAVPTDHAGNEVMDHSAPAQPAVSWDDSLAGLSIGGLLSEASLLNKISNSTLKSDSRSGLQPILVSDISIGGLLREASLQDKITNPSLKSENKSGLPSKESVAGIRTGGLSSEVNKLVNPDMKTENEAGLDHIPLVSEISVGALLSEASLLGKIDAHSTCLDNKLLGLQPLSENRAPQSLWDDGLTTLSIGGLLSEASLQEKIVNSDLKSGGGASNLQSRIPNFDSFDAFLAAQFDSQSQTANPSLLDFHAEDTCHAFPFQELSLFNNKDSKVSNERDISGGDFDDSRPKTLIFPRRHKCFPNDSLQAKTRETK